MILVKVVYDEVVGYEEPNFDDERLFRGTDINQLRCAVCTVACRVGVHSSSQASCNWKMENVETRYCWNDRMGVVSMRRSDVAFHESEVSLYHCVVFDKTGDFFLIRRFDPSTFRRYLHSSPKASERF